MSASSDAADSAETGPNSQVASSNQMAHVEDVVESGMVPIYGISLNDGVYNVTMDSGSSMFRITKCRLTVSAGEMTAEMYMGER